MGLCFFFMDFVFVSCAFYCFSFILACFGFACLSSKEREKKKIWSWIIEEVASLLEEEMG